MPRRSMGALWLALFSVVLVTQGLAADRPWTVQDSIAVQYFVSDLIRPGNIRPPMPGDEPAHFSPDGAHFFFVSFHGDLPNDRTVYDLWIYSTEAVRRALRGGSHRESNALPPRRKVSMQSGFPGNTTSAAIYFPQWESNSTLTFAGTEGRESRRVFRYDITSGQPTALSEPQYVLPESAGINHAVRGTSVMFQTFHKTAREPRYPFDIVDPKLLEDWFDRSEQDAFRYHASYKGAPAKVIVEGPMGHGLYGPWISPNEKWAVMVYPAKDSQAIPDDAAYAFRVSPLRYLLVDLEAGSSRPLLRGFPGPERFFNRTMSSLGRGGWPAFWSADSGHVLVLNVALPLDAQASARRSASFAIDYDLERGEWSVVDVFASSDRQSVGEAAWLEEGTSVIVEHRDEPKRGKRLEARIYSFAGGRWTVRPADNLPLPATGRKPDDFAVRIRQSANEPPRMVAASRTSELTLSPPDPALQGVWRAPVETIHWKDAEGNDVESLLMLPREFSKERAPLVIQLSDPWNPPDAFLPDGEPGTGFAAQALTAQGFVVLQTEPGGWLTAERKFDPAISQTAKEGPAQVRRVDAAVAMLKRRGLIDNRPIGLIGFSRSGYYVYYVITHPGRTPVGAAVVFDSITYGYGSYVNFAASRGVDEVEHYGRQYGNGQANFWQDKQAWLDAPAFNLDRLTTPTLFHVTGEPIYAAETVGAFQLARRPFEYHYHPGAGHILKAPRQREAAMQSTIDWMNFWLRGRERQAPDRFERWRKIKADWQRTLLDEAAAAR